MWEGSSTSSYLNATDESERRNRLGEELKNARLTINQLKKQNGVLRQQIDEDYRKFEREKTIIQTEKGREITKQKKDNNRLNTELNNQKTEKVKLSDQFQKSLAEWKSRVDSLEETLLQKEKELGRLQLELQQQEDQKIILTKYDKQLEQLKDQYRQLQSEIDEANGGEKEKPFNSNDMGLFIVQKQDVLMQCMAAHIARSECYQTENRDAFRQINARLDQLKSVEETNEQTEGMETQGPERTPSPLKPRTREPVRLRRDKTKAKLPVKTEKKPFSVPKVINQKLNI